MRHDPPRTATIAEEAAEDAAGLGPAPAWPAGRNGPPVDLSGYDRLEVAADWTSGGVAWAVLARTPSGAAVPLARPDTRAGALAKAAGLALAAGLPIHIRPVPAGLPEPADETTLVEVSTRHLTRTTLELLWDLPETLQNQYGSMVLPVPPDDDDDTPDDLAALFHALRPVAEHVLLVEDGQEHSALPVRW